MKRVLLVDDSPDVRMLVRVGLRGSSYQLDESEDAQMALDRIDRQTYDAILLDIELPEMDGKSLARKIRNLGGHWKAVPLIALTGYTDPQDVRACMDAGFSRHLAKPVRKELLLQTLDELTGGASDPAYPAAQAIDPAILEMGPQYLAKRERELALLRETLAQGNFAELRRLGHNMKGTGPAYGFPSLGKIGAQIELSAKAGDARQLDELIQHLEREVQSLLSERVG